MSDTDSKIHSTLVYGIGNLGRQDDGLGIRFVEQVEGKLPGNVDYSQNYLLQIEDAETISHYDHVIFVDATKDEGVDDFILKPLKPLFHANFSTHSLRPQEVVALCQRYFSKFPECQLLEIRGYKWDYSTEITPKAEKNLSAGGEMFIDLFSPKSC